VRQRRHLRFYLKIERGKGDLTPVRPAGEPAGADLLQLSAAGGFQHRRPVAEEARHGGVARDDPSAHLHQGGRARNSLQHFLEPRRLAPSGDERLIAPSQLV
jgi:hypothetical protein